MDSRPLLSKIEKVGVLIDSDSFENALENNSREALAILGHENNKNLHFIRTPLISKFSDLNQIPEYQLEIAPDDSDGWQSGSLQYITKKSENICAFRYRKIDIKFVAQKILKKKNL